MKWVVHYRCPNTGSVKKAFKVNGQSSQDVTMSFVIPEGANKVELEVGKPAIQQTARIPIALKATQAQVTASP
jgi:hypothetical protein